MASIFSILVPFIAGYELMDWWENRTQDPRVLQMRAQKAFARQNAIKPPESSETKLLSEKVNILSTTVHKHENKIYDLLCDTSRLSNIQEGLANTQDDFRHAQDDFRSQMQENRINSIVINEEMSRLMDQLEVRLKDEIKKVLEEHMKQNGQP